MENTLSLILKLFWTSDVENKLRPRKTKVIHGAKTTATLTFQPPDPPASPPSHESAKRSHSEDSQTRSEKPQSVLVIL